MKEYFGPRKENNSIQGPLLNHLTSEKTKQNFSSTLMLQAGCIYLGLIAPCPETFHPLHPPRRLIAPCPTINVISTKEYSKYPAWLTFPLSLCKTQNSGLRSKEEKPRDSLNQPSRCNTQEGLLSVAQMGDSDLLGGRAPRTANWASFL